MTEDIETCDGDIRGNAQREWTQRWRRTLTTTSVSPIDYIGHGHSFEGNKDGCLILVVPQGRYKHCRRHKLVNSLHCRVPPSPCNTLDVKIQHMNTQHIALHTCLTMQPCKTCEMMIATLGSPITGMSFTPCFPLHTKVSRLHLNLASGY